MHCVKRVTWRASVGYFVNSCLLSPVVCCIRASLASSRLRCATAHSRGTVFFMTFFLEPFCLQACIGRRKAHTSYPKVLMRIHRSAASAAVPTFIIWLSGIGELGL